MIREIADELGFTQEDLARLWNCSRRTVIGRIDDEGSVRLDELWQIAKAEKHPFSITDCVRIVYGRKISQKEFGEMPL